MIKTSHFYYDPLVLVVAKVFHEIGKINKKKQRITN